MKKGKLSEAQVRDVYLLAKKIQDTAAKLNLSVRNHANPRIQTLAILSRPISPR